MSASRLHVILLTWALLIAGVSFLQPAVGEAQVTTSITSSGLGTTVTQTGPLNDITGGTRRGSNLFHSFGLFNVGTGDTANFLNDSGLATSNILGRVNGGQTSSIFGTIQTSNFGSANLFLINPAGWIFGPTASLNVGGSFHVSTADYIRLNDGVRFNADGLNDALLTSAPPAAFGFLGLNPPASITVSGSSLQVPEGQTLSLVGGDVQITGAALSAPSGRVQIASLTSGEVALVTPEGTPDLRPDPTATLGQINISGFSSIDANDVSGIGGGTVIIRGGSLFIDASSIASNTVGDVDGAPVGIDLQATGDMVFSGGSNISVSAQQAGNAGAVQIEVGSLEMRGSSLIETTTTGGVAGDASRGVGGNVDINVGTFSLTEGAKIRSFTAEGAGPGGPGGNLSVNATGPVVISGLDSEVTSRTASSSPSGIGGNVTITTPSLSLDSGGAITTVAFNAASGGDVTLQANQLSMANGAAIFSRSTATGPDVNGGDIRVTATGSAQISGIETGIFGGAGEGSVGGDILMEVGRLTLTSGAQILNGSNIGQAGNLTVSATDSIVISDGSGIASQAFGQTAGQATISAPSLLIDNGFISTSTIGSGDAGPIAVNVGTLTLKNGGQIASNSALSASGAGGNVTVTTTDSISISGSSPNGVPSAPSGTDPSSGLFSTASGTGNAGQISVSTPTLTMGDGGTISVATSSSGNAGNVSLNVGNLTQTGGARVDSSTTGAGHGGNVTVAASGTVSISDQGSGLFSTASGTGAGGNVSVQAQNVSLLNGGTISANSTGTATATAGNIDIVVGDTLRMEDSSITTEAAVADGGNISITSTGSLVHLTNSQIATSVQSGSGGGGNITIGSQLHPFDFLILNESGVHADAFGGPGGNINIFADILLSSVPLLTAITASSELNTPGTIDIAATVTQFTGNISQLPEAPLQATELLRATCAARVASGRLSSLVLGGRGGLPLEPGGLLPSPLHLGADSAISFDNHGRPGEQPTLSPSSFSILASDNKRPLLRLGWDQFQLAKTALGLDCGQ